MPGVEPFQDLPDAKLNHLARWLDVVKRTELESEILSRPCDESVAELLFLSILSRICGLIPVQEEAPTCDKGLFIAPPKPIKWTA